MFQLSFIRYCVKEERCRWISTIADFFRLKDTLDELRYKKKRGCAVNLKKFIFRELKGKADYAKTRETTKEIYSARGDYVLKVSNQRLYPSIRDSLSDKVEYDESLLLWHIATELSYFTSSDPNDDHDHDHDYDYRELCKVLSDYMLYLLVMRPALMSAVAGIAQIRFQDTCAEAKKFFKRFERMTYDQRQEACQKLLDVIRDDKPEEEMGVKSNKREVKPKDVKGDRSKSLLFDACILAHDLKKLGDQQWKIMSRVWVELLSYGASHCRASEHARQLSQGGEFITFVWLLMVHCGLGEQFRIEAGHARAKLLVDHQFQID